MEGQRFDDLTRRLTATLNRRRVMASLLGVAGAAALGSGAEARVRCRAWDASCTRSSQCCTAYCETSRQAPRRQRNRCGCGPLALCGNTCFDLQTDEKHCGACDTACEPGFTCTNGVCKCGEETTCNGACCDGVCKKTFSDKNHCGACGIVCATGEFCIGGNCVSACAAPTPNSGDCGQYTACLIDQNGTTHYLDSWYQIGGYGCGEPGGQSCAAGELCRVGFNSGTTAAWMDIMAEYPSGIRGECVKNVSYCTP